MHHRQSLLGDLGNPTFFSFVAFSILRLAQGVTAEFLLGVLWHVEILMALENVRIPKHSYLQAFVVKHAVYIMKSIEIGPILRINRRIHRTLHTYLNNHHLWTVATSLQQGKTC